MFAGKNIVYIVVAILIISLIQLRWPFINGVGRIDTRGGNHNVTGEPPSDTALPRTQPSSTLGLSPTLLPTRPPSIEPLDVFGSLFSGNLATWDRPWGPGATGATCERSRLQASYNALYVNVVSTFGTGLSKLGDCPFSNGMDEWSALRYLKQTTALFLRDNMQPHVGSRKEAPPFVGCAKEVSVDNATAPPTPDETASVERIKQMYVLYRQEILSTLSTAPLTYYSDACGSALPVSLIATCLTAATLAATTSELSQVNESSFSIFSSIARFRTTVCAHTILCLSWRTGHWDAKLPKHRESKPKTASVVSTHGNAVGIFESVFMATVGPRNPNSERDIRRLRERRSTVFPWSSIGMAHPRYRALQVQDTVLEFSYSRGVFTARSGGVEGVQTLDLPPNVFFIRVLNASRSVVRATGGQRQRFPSLIIFDGDSLYRGLINAAIQRLREHGLGSTTTYPLDANAYEVLTPTHNSAAHGESVYFMYPSPTGMLDVLLDRRGSQKKVSPKKDGMANFNKQRRKCAEALRGRISAVNDTALTQRWILKFLSSTMVGLPDNMEMEVEGGTTLNASYAPRTFIDVEKGTDLILYAHILCGSPAKGSTFTPRYNCPLVAMMYTFNKVQQRPRTHTWSLESLKARQRAFKSAKSVNLPVNPLQLVDAVNVGMRVHGAGAWSNNFQDSVLNAAALSFDTSSEPPITINRLATTHTRHFFRDSCALIQMKEGRCSRKRTTSPGSDITGLCSFVYPNRTGSHIRTSWDAYPKEYIRYNGKFKRENDTNEADTNIVFEGYAQAVMAIWESSVCKTPNNTIFSDWCLTSMGQLNKSSTSANGTKEVVASLTTLCGNPLLMDAVGPLVVNTTTVFYDAALLRSLSPFKTKDTLHYDCTIDTILKDSSKRVLRRPGMFTFPNNTLRAMASLSESLCITPTLDAAGLAHLLTSTFASHFSTDMMINALYSSIPAATEGSLTVGVPTTYTNDHCRVTFQRSELSLLFGARI